MEESRHDPASVPEQIFTNFLREIAQAGIPADIVERLGKKLLDDQQYSEKALKAAIMPEDTIP